MSDFKILVTTDFSPESFAAFSEARREAESAQAAEVLLVYVLNESLLDFQGKFSPGPTAEQIEDISTRVEQLLKKELENNFSELTASAHVIRGQKPVAQAIVDYANTGNVDLIIMSSYGKSGLKEFFLGSTTQRILETAGCPVLVVPS